MNFKSTSLLAFTLCILHLSFGQENLKFQKSDNAKLIKALNDGEMIAENTANYLSVKIYKLDNGSGSAGIPEGHEVSHNLLVAVSEFDEDPKQNLFEIGPFLNPEFSSWSEISGYKKMFEIEFGFYENRQNIKLSVSINELKKE